MRTQTITHKGPTLPPVLASGGPAAFVGVSFPLEEMPEGDWHLRALTKQGLEIPAEALALDPETLKVTATFANYFNVAADITGFAVDQA